MPVYGVYGPLGVLDPRIEEDPARMLAALQRIEDILKDKMDLAQKERENKRKIDALNADFS